MKDTLLNKVVGAMKPYSKAWDRWIATEYCFLTDQELKYLNLLLKFKTVRAVVDTVRTSEKTIRKVINSGLAKLVRGLSIYRYWLTRCDVVISPQLKIVITCIKTPSSNKENLFPVADAFIKILATYNVSDTRRMGISAKVLTDLSWLLENFGKGDSVPGNKRRARIKRRGSEKFGSGLNPTTPLFSIRTDQDLTSRTASTVNLSHSFFPPRGSYGRFQLKPPIRKINDDTIN